MLRPIERLTVTDAIINQIRALIVEGRVRPGEKLPPERELASMLRVGRTSVREALRVLGALGLVRRTPEGTFVTGRIDERSLGAAGRLASFEWSADDLYDLRQAVEPTAARLAARRRTDEDLHVLADVLDAQRRASSRVEFTDADMSFHVSVAESSHNVLVAEVVRWFSELMGSQMNRDFARLFEEAPGNARETIERFDAAALREHDRILGAIQAGDDTGAHEAMVSHLEGTRKRYEELRERLSRC